MAALYERLVKWLAPVLCFTAEEAWRSRNPGEAESVHLHVFPQTPATWKDDALAAKWTKLRDLRRVVTGALEVARAEKKIGSSLQAAPAVHVESTEVSAATSAEAWNEIFITSAHAFSTQAAPADAFRLADVPGVAVVVGLAAGTKCDRCWKVLPDVGTRAAHPSLCARCADVVGA